MLVLKPSLKRFFVSLLAAFGGLSLMVYSYLFMPQSFHSLDNRFRDFFFIYRGEVETKAPVVIVDIDEKSLKHYGQFPWDRKLMSDLLLKITSHKPIVIGMDIVFSEPDKRSPSYFGKKLKLNQEFEDYDQILADTFAKTPTILGYSFDFDLDMNSSVFIATPGMLKHKESSINSNFPKAKGIVPNLQIFHDSAYSSGFFNSAIGYEHKVRVVPTVISYDKNAYLSLDLEIYRAIMGFNKTTIYYLQNGNTYDADMIEFKSKDKKQNIKVDAYGQIYVNFRGKGHSYNYISAYDILTDRVSNDALKDKIILIGTSAKGLVDLRATPMDNSMPGVEVHANIIDNLINEDYIHAPTNFQLIDILTIIIIALVVTVLFSYLPPLLLTLTSILSLFAMCYFYYYLLFDKHLILNILYPFLTFILSAATALIIGYMFEKRQKELIKTKFASKVSKNVMDNLIKTDMKNLFEGQDKEITIFFSDIRSFSTLSEKLEPKVLIKLLNEYMSPMSDFITKRNGTIDKFIGDAIMAYWNAPADVRNHADEALKCAIEQIKYKDTLNKILKQNFGIEIDFGIGINTGAATVGEMGSTNRSDYTVLGNNVNIASRLEGLCPVYGVNLIFSSFTKDKLKETYNILKIDKIRVKGIHQPLDIYTLTEANDKFINGFNKGLELYQNGDFNKSLEYFNIIDKMILPNLVEIYKTRCKNFIKNPPKDFDGVCSYTHK